LIPEENPYLGGADPRGVFQHRLEHRLQLPGRRADDAKHLRCGRLLLKRFVQLLRFAVELRLQPGRAGSFGAFAPGPALGDDRALAARGFAPPQFCYFTARIAGSLHASRHSPRQKSR
jgi:hypothetical protein